MKKNLIIILVLAVVVVGIVMFSSKSKQGGEIISPSQVTEETATVTKGAAAGLFASLGDSYQCTYTIEDNIKVTAYVKNGKMRTEIPVSGDNAKVALYTDYKVYQWSTKDKQGILMTVAAAKQEDGTKVQDPLQYLNSLMAEYQPDCKKMNLADNLFVVPKDIQFQDLSQFQ